MTLKGTFPVNSIAEKTILPIQRKKISLALKIISVGKNVVKSLVFLGHPKVANGQSAEENHVSSTSPSPSTGTLCPHQSCLEIFQSLTCLNQLMNICFLEAGMKRTGRGRGGEERRT